MTEPAPPTPEPAPLAEFLAASVAVWREIDRLDAEPDGYHPMRMSVELRQRERAAWERYRDHLDGVVPAGRGAADPDQSLYGTEWDPRPEFGGRAAADGGGT